MPEPVRRYAERVATQVDAVPPLGTLEGQIYVRAHRGEFLAGTLIHILRQLHADWAVPDEVAQDLIDLCKASLLGLDPDTPANTDIARLTALIQRTAKHSFRSDASYTPEDFIHDFLVDYLFPALDGRDVNPYWVSSTHKKVGYRLQDARRKARLDNNGRGVSEAGSKTSIKWDDDVPEEYSETMDQLESLAEALEHRAVQAALQRLPANYRRVVDLYFEGAPIKKRKSPRGDSIEEIVGRSHVAIFSWVDAALNQLRDDPEFLRAMTDIREGRTGGSGRRTKQSKQSEAP